MRNHHIQVSPHRTFRVGKYQVDQPVQGIRKQGGMLLQQINFPSKLERGDYASKFWVHERPECVARPLTRWETITPIETWRLACEKLEYQLPTREECAEHPGMREYVRNGGQLLIDVATPGSFLEMLQFLVGKKFKVTGGQAVLFCVHHGKYPVMNVSAVWTPPGRTVYSGNDGPHILQGGMTHIPDICPLHGRKPHA